MSATSSSRSRDLQAAAVARTGPRIAHFGDAAAEALAALEGNAVFDLQHLALIAVTGADAEAFLQGQLTSDIGEVDAHRAQPSAWCSPKGRVLSCFLVFRHDGCLMLQLPAPLLEPTLKRLRMYVLRARATLDDASDSCARMGAIGERTESRLRERVGTLPQHPQAVCSNDELTIIRLAGERPRYEIVGTHEAVESLWNDCRQVAAAAGADAWDLLEIEAGIATIGPETSDAFVPQMINLDRIGAVSFTKGCYVGQEIVARTQHLGRIKRRMYRARLSGPTRVGPGDTLETSDETAPAKVQIVNAGLLAHGGFDVLAVLPIELAGRVADAGLMLDDGARLELENLPYALEEETG